MSKILRKLNNSLKSKLESINESTIVVAIAKKYSEAEITKGDLNHLGIRLEDGNLIFPNTIIPLHTQGRISKKNSQGYSITRRDLPKAPKRFDLGPRPIFGDWNKGSYNLYVTKLVFQKEHYLPELGLSIELIDDSITNSVRTFVLKFTIDEIYNKEDANFEADLLFGINLLLENLGNADIYSTSASPQEFILNKYLNCEFLPPGLRDDDLSFLMSRFRNLTPALRAQIQERYNLLRSMNPIEFIYGISGIRRYFGAKFADDLVVFENLEFGNAIYIFFDNWDHLSRLSRKQILNRPENDYIKINHSSGWQDKLRRTISNRLNSRESAA